MVKIKQKNSGTNTSCLCAINDRNGSSLVTIETNVCERLSNKLHKKFTPFNNYLQDFEQLVSN